MRPKIAYAIAETMAHSEPHLRLVYPGLLNEERGLFVMIDAMEELNRATPARLWLMGLEGSEDIIDRARARPGWKHVDYLGLRSQAEAFAYMIAADVGLIVFQPEGDNQVLNPNKLFEYQRFATPFVASDFPVWRSFVKDIEAGKWVDPTSAEEVARALSWVASHPEQAKALGKNGQDFVLHTYNWENEAEKLLDMHTELSR